MHGVHGSPVLLSGETKEEQRNRFFYKFILLLFIEKKPRV